MKIVWTTLRLFLLMVVLTGVVYPLFVTLIARVTMPNRAGGSLVVREGEVVGSRLIAQKSTSDRYFWPRPSAIDYDPLHPSGGSNLGPTSERLKADVERRSQMWGDGAPAELLYASGSGLDPHLSIEAALFQVPRVAKGRAMEEEELTDLVLSMKEGRLLGFIGPEYVNILRLNEALDGRSRQ